MRGLITAGLLAAAPALAQDPGADLFNRGEGATALLADGAVELPATGFACAGCHGSDGQGGREGATVFPPLIFDQGPVHSTAQLAAALSDGLGADGHVLGAAMPRYRLDPSLIDALHGHLSHLAAASRAGITPDTLLIAPPADPALHQAFQRALDQANAEGGAWGRVFRPAMPPDVLIEVDAVAGKAEDPAITPEGQVTVAIDAIALAARVCGRAISRRCLREQLGDGRR